MVAQRQPEANELVARLCHEIGNLIAAVRLHAHLLDDDLGPRGLARAGLELEALGARSSALLSLVRPLLSGVDPGSRSQAAALVASVEDEVQELGLRGVALRVELEPGLPELRYDHHALHSVLTFLATTALETLSGQGALRLAASRGADGETVELLVADSGPEDAALLAWEREGQRGRALVAAAAAALLAAGPGGRVETERSADETRIRVCVPAVSS